MPQRDRHVHPGPVQQDQDLPGPRAVRPSRPGPPVVPGEQGGGMHVAGQNPERGPQVSHVQSPPHDGVGQGTADHVSAGPCRQLGIEGTHPRLHPGGALRRAPRTGVHDIVHRRQRRPQRPATRPQHPRHQSRQCVDRRVTFTYRAPAPAVRIPQSRPARAVSPAIIPGQGRRRPRRQPTSGDHHALVSWQLDRTCEGLPRQRDQYHNRPQPESIGSCAVSRPLRRALPTVLRVLASAARQNRSYCRVTAVYC